jgi:hypothetical protein
MTHHEIHWDTDCMTCKYNSSSCCFNNPTCTGCDMVREEAELPGCKCFEKCDSDETECPYYKEA